MTTIDTDPGEILTTFPTQTVELSTDIKDPSGWTEIPFLWCSQLKLAVNAYDTAKLRFEIGHGVLQPGDDHFDDWQPLDIRGKYVRITIELDEPIVWVGYVLNQVHQRDGVKEYLGGEKKFEGEAQTFDVVGLEWFLDRKQIDSAIVYKEVEDPDADNPDYIRIKRALKFNGGESQTLDMKAAERGNRSITTIFDGTYVFSDDPTTTDKFDAADIVIYLLTFFTPLDRSGDTAPCAFQLAAGCTTFLTCFKPTLATEHSTTFQLLNKLCSPQRGLVWWLEYDSVETPSIAYIRVASMGDENISLPGGGTFPANGDPIELNFDTEVDVKDVEIKDLGQRRYHRVICRGARQTCTFTVGMEDGTLTTDWKDEALDAYSEAASGDGDYGDLTRAKKSDRNDAMRQTDLFGRVFAYFRIPADWDGKTGDGGDPDAGGAAHHFAIAEIHSGGSIIGGLPLTTQGIRLLNRTRLKMGYNYEDSSAPVSNAPDGSLEEFMPPFAIVKVEHEPAINENAFPNRWQYCNKLNNSVFHAGTRVAPNIHTSYQLHMQEHVPGLVMHAGGSPQHTLALNYFDGGADGPDEPSKVKPEVSYDTIRATVCAESDNYAEGTYVVDPLPDPPIPIEELIVDLGDDYRLDFLAQNTIVHLDKGLPKLADEPAILRDDRKTLSDIARIAGEWYREDRQSLTVKFRQHRGLFSLGQLVTTIGEGSAQSTINTVISVINYDFTKGGGMTIETSDKTLDARSLV